MEIETLKARITQTASEITMAGQQQILDYQPKSATSVDTTANY